MAVSFAILEKDKIESTGLVMSDRTRGKTGPRLKDVAKKAGVSEPTASLVFSGRGRISEETKTIVMDAARTLGYSHQTREKRNGLDGKNVGILILIDRDSTFLWHFLSEMIAQINHDLEENNLRSLMIPVSLQDSNDKIYQRINSLGCRAVFSVHMGRETLFNRLEQDGIPVIVIMNNQLQNKFFSICVDDFLVGFDGTQKLLNMGHKRINFVDDFREDLPSLSSDRYYGYRKALEEAGLPYKEEYKFNCVTTPSEEDVEKRFRCMLDSSDPPTAFYCLDDEIAFRVWNGLQKLGYCIPEDISILAPGDVLDYSKPYIPPISTMQINMRELGQLAVNMLQNRLNSKLETQQILKVTPRLFERGSCRKL